MRDVVGTVARRDLVVCVSPFERPDPRVVLGAARAGALGVLDLGRDARKADRALTEVAQKTEARFGVRVPSGCPVGSGRLPAQVDTVVLAGLPSKGAEPFGDWGAGGRRVLVEVRTLAEGHEALTGGADGVVARGGESGGRVGEETAYVLLSALVDAGIGPIWVAGGIGVHTAAGVIAGGASGVFLDSQLALTIESSVPVSVREAIRGMDGSETVVVAGHRVLWLPGTLAARMVGRDGSPSPASTMPEPDGATVSSLLGGEDLRAQLVPVGQEGAFAAPFADRWRTVEGVVHGLRRQITGHLSAARSRDPLGPGSPLAEAHGLTYPVAQGPMTRVSDRAAFAEEVALAGGLPFLALALMPGHEARELLTETATLLADRPWGVGILGFVPAAVRDEQLEVIHEIRPPVALIAGGRPSQARSLEEAGIATYLHVPSPGLLAQFLRDGARRFVFEGRECGGHVGPRSSLSLWEAQIEVLLGSGMADQVSVLFAGGVHDARSAAVVAATGASLAEAGGRIGVLMGTAYLFTSQAVDGGAVVPGFQDQALACTRTVLLETSPGHATRCADTDYVRAFQEERARLIQEGASPQSAWAALEVMNLGRLRVAAKGLAHGDDGPVAVEPEVQQREGMFMLGQVAALRSTTTTVADLHEQVSVGSGRVLSDLEGRFPAMTADARPSAPAPADVAIVGMACVFPGAPDVEAFWSNVVTGLDAVTEVPVERWDPDRYYDPEALAHGAGRKTPSKWGGFLPQVPFDALAFGIPPASLASIEPVQLLSLKVAADAMADAGYGPESRRELDRERVSVIFGAEAGTDLAGAYGFRALAGQYLGGLPDELDELLPQLTEDSFPGLLTNVIAGRIANRLDLGGVNYTVDAACASSLAAVDAAVKELRAGTSDMVLCGGADLHNGINDYLLFSAVHALSPSGRCASFDASADGIALGEGVACVVLKRLEDARRDGTRIYAVIAGIAGSSDGRSLGLTAPRPEGQRRALERAYAQARIAPDEVGLVEAHGTGTVVGDRTELTVLNELFSSAGAAPQSCGLGSVKSQIGHTKCAAGLAALIKTARAIHHGVLPPTLHVEEPNPAYDGKDGPFALRTSASPWADDCRVAGVSAFGFGGTNFHMVLRSDSDESTPSPSFGTKVWPEELFLVRGADRRDAMSYLKQVVRLLSTLPTGNGRAAVPSTYLASLASAAAARSGRVHAALVVGDLEDLARKSVLASAALGQDGSHGRIEDGVHVAPAEGQPEPKVAFLFPGQGSQRPDMLADVFVAFPRLHGHLRQGRRWLETMYPPSAFSAAERKDQAKALTDTTVAQPTLGLAGLAMADLLCACGVRPSMAGGHSYGELVALALAGSLPRDRLCEISEERAGAIVAAAGDDPGAMAAVSGGAEDVAGILREVPGVVLGNDNAPEQVVLSGPTVDLEKASARLAELGVASKRLPVACAFHSPVVADAASRFGRYLDELEVCPPELPVWSNTTAQPYPQSPVEVRRLVSEQLAKPVRFREQIEEMHRAGARIFVEVGPGKVLTGLVDRILKGKEHQAVAIEGTKGSAVHGLLDLLALLSASGVDLDAGPLFDGRVVPVDVASPPVEPPGWLVDGQLVRTVAGPVVTGALRPATELHGVKAGDRSSGAPSEDIVVEYLRAMREMVAATHEVMLGYLGQPVTSLELGGSTVTNDTGSVVADPAEPDAPPRRGPLRGDDLRRTVLEVVAARTGYPVDMLDPALDLEADLSIDSIKRLEIVGELVDRIGLVVQGSEDVLEESIVEELVAVKTLDGIVTWLEEAVGSVERPGSTSLTDGPDGAPGAVDEPHALPLGAPPPRAQRFVPRVQDVPYPAKVDTAALDGRRVVITDDGSGVAGELSRVLSGHGAAVRVASPEASIEDADVLVHMGALYGPASTALMPFLERTKEAVSGSASTVIAVTGSGGRFAMDAGGHAPSAPSGGDDGVGAIIVHAGMRGMVKTLAQERPGIRALVVDVDPALAPSEVAAAVAEEILADDGLLEVGRSRDARVTVRVVDAGDEADRHGGALLSAAHDHDHDHDRDRHHDQVVLDPGMVVLLTGGARGITARVSEALVERVGCIVVLAGRTPDPEAPETEITVSAPDAPAVRRTLIDAGFGAPAQIEAEVRRIMSEREVRTTLDRLRRVGGQVHYRCVDVSEPDQVRELINSVRRDFGRLDGIVHGAGIVEDGRLVDKSPESFRRVFDTKVTLPAVLAESLVNGLSFVVVFGSVSGVFGNRGQVDYAAANAAAAAVARELDRRSPTRVLVADWGPWSGGGMVSSALEQEFIRRGVGLLDPDDAVDILLGELASGVPEPEVVIMRATPESFS